MAGMEENVSHRSFLKSGSGSNTCLNHLVQALEDVFNGTNLLGRVNSVLGSSGILPTTGYKYVGRTPFNRQIENVLDMKKKMASMMYPLAEMARYFISEALVYINIGSYDYVSNYFLHDSKAS